MKYILNKKRGSSMLLAICIFMLLAVLGINVLAASYSGVQNMKSKYETEQTLQYLNSIYEIVDQKIRDGEFILDGYLTSGTEEQEISRTNEVSLTADAGDSVVTYAVFFKTGKLNELKAEIYMKYKEQGYNVTSVYEYNGHVGASRTYTMTQCEGVTALED